MIQLSKEQKNDIILRLHRAASDYESFEYGLPIFDAGQMALMREEIDEALKPKPAPTGDIEDGQDA
jgi:hypothetical protein